MKLKGRMHTPSNSIVAPKDVSIFQSYYNLVMFSACSGMQIKMLSTPGAELAPSIVSIWQDLNVDVRNADDTITTE